jgi:hypothetical protein
MDIVDAQVTMVPRIGRMAGDGEGRDNRCDTEDAVTKPAPGFKTHRPHHAPRPERASALYEPTPVRFCGIGASL